jgi:hypothetical protein
MTSLSETGVLPIMSWVVPFWNVSPVTRPHDCWVTDTALPEMSVADTWTV